jgi:anti-sigma factor RsiW
MNCREIEEFAPLYLSGELLEDQRISFNTHLSECRSCAREMEQQAALDARVAQTALPDSTVVERRVRGQIAAERRRRVAKLGAAVAAGILFGAVLGYRALRPERLYTDAALDHRLEVMEHQPRRWRSDPAEVEKLAARYQLSSTSALAPEGYRLEHAKMCGIAGEPALHLVYTNGLQEFSVYIRRRSGAKGTLHAVRVGSEQLAVVQSDRLEAVVATAGSSGECLQFARAAQSVL